MLVETPFSDPGIPPHLRIAVVHEWFTRWAGSEAVLEQILACLPTAELFAVASHPDAEGRQRLAGRRIQTSFIQRLPFGAKRPQVWLPWLPQAVEQLDLRGFDLVISNSHCVAKGVITSPDCVHLAYVHSPARYAWDLQHVYAQEIPWPLRGLWRAQMQRLRNWDMASAVRPDAIACNSNYIARRVAHAWGRNAQVIHPPVAVDEFTLGTSRGDAYVTASRMVGYKQVPLIARTFAKTPQRRLIVIGDGPELPQVQAIARDAPHIRVLGHLPRTEVIRHLREARAFIFAAEEDFGISPVEALACGTPVIAFGKGGAVETVVDGITGLFFERQEEDCLAAALNRYEAGPVPDPAACRAQALKFSPEIFRERFMHFVSAALRERRLGNPRVF